MFCGGSSKSGDGLRWALKNGFFTGFEFLTGPGGSGEGVRILVSLTLTWPMPPENSLRSSLNRLSRARERLRDRPPRLYSRAMRRGLGLFGSLREGKFPRNISTGGLMERGGRIGLRRKGLRRNGLRWRLRP